MSKVNSKERDAVRKLMIAVNKIDGSWYKLAKISGITDNKLSLLLALDDGEPRTQKQICEEWMIPKTTINSTVKYCLAEGLIEFSPEDLSKREKKIFLTEKGQKYANEVLSLFYKAENSAMEKTLKHFSDEFLLATKAYSEFLKEEIDALSNSH